MEIDHEIFSTVILSLPLIQEGQLSVSGEKLCTILVNCLEPVSVAQLDACPTGDQSRSATFFEIEIDHEIISTVILSLQLIQDEQLSVSGERMCTILVYHLED